MAVETLSLLVSITVLLKATRGDVEHCTKGTCTTKPLGFNCNVVYEERVLRTKLPDGALRDLPGTVRGLSLLVSNTDPLSDPSLIIGWRPPEVAVSVFEVYLLTWDNHKPGKASVPFPCMFVVKVTDTSQITKIELRVTSSTFRNSKDITVYVNTWLGNKEPCFLRQAKVTFYATDSLQLTPAFWNYLLSMALPGNDSLQLSFHPLPNATRHMVQVCLKTHLQEGTQRRSGYQCSKFRSLRQGTKTGIFQFSKTCATYRIQIIPVPNAYRQVYRVHRFVPALKSPSRDPVALSLLESASLSSNTPKVKDRHGVNVILVSVLASLLGLAAGIAFIWKRVRRRRCWYSPPTNGNYELLQYPTAHNTDIDAESDVEFWSELRRTTVKNIFLLYSEDCECHLEVVESLSRCLETSFKCRVRQVDRAKDIDTQLETIYVVLLVSSKDVFTSLDLHRSKLPQIQDPITQTAGDMGRVIDRLLEAYSDRVVMVRLAFTENQYVIQSPNNHVFTIPGHMSDLICRIHKLGDLAAEHSMRKWLTTRPEAKDLMSSIEKASKCCGRSSCSVTRNPGAGLFQDSHVVAVQDIGALDRQMVDFQDLGGQTEVFEDLDGQGAYAGELKDLGEQGWNGMVLEELGGRGEDRVEVKKFTGQIGRYRAIRWTPS
ncbi:uncharacterized protein LOC124258638 [Haliotis rubra]|uniref:uncharacterized protein LOC124258638 n=1 Tax=Haliotis rubra TaxID=36100 RepID=UPI001EE4EC5A|nr:uncharacterized protein LOC124258638 [Haliotis rubra]